MKKPIILIIDQLKNRRTLHLSAYLVLFCFTIAPFLASVSLIIFSFFAIIHTKRANFHKAKLVAILLFSSLLFLYLIGFIYSPNKERAINLIIRVLPLLFVPILIVGSNLQQDINVFTLKKYYTKGLLLSITISLIAAFYNFYVTNDYGAFTYYDLGAFLHIHPTYYSLYVLVGIIFLSNKVEQFIRKQKTILLVFTLFVVLLQSKMAIILMLVYFIFLLFNKKIRSVKRNMYLLIFLIVASIVIGFNTGNSRLTEFNINTDENAIGSFNENGVHQRVWLWENALSQIKESVFFGFGLGSQKNLFSWKVEKNLLDSNNTIPYQNAAKKIASLNLHNQYMQILYELGFLGLIIFLTTSIIIIIKAYKKRKSHSFLLIYVCFCGFLITENLFDRQLGVYFFSFLIPLHYFLLTRTEVDS